MRSFSSRRYSPDVGVDNNIALAENLYTTWSLNGQSEPGSRGASATMLNYNRPEWFKEQTGDHGPMDYKYLTTDMRYDNFGNFNYGAVGAAIRYSADTLLRVAGWVQQHGNYAYLGEGTGPSTFLAALSGSGEPIRTATNPAMSYKSKTAWTITIAGKSTRSNEVEIDDFHKVRCRGDCRCAVGHILDWNIDQADDSQKRCFCPSI